MNRQRIVKGERGNFHLSTGNMIRKPKAEFIENVAIITGLTLIQFLYSGNSILLSYLLKLGFQPSSLIIFSTFATFLLLSPISILFERRVSDFFFTLLCNLRERKIKIKLIINIYRIFLLAGVNGQNILVTRFGLSCFCFLLEGMFYAFFFSSSSSVKYSN